MSPEDRLTENPRVVRPDDRPPFVGPAVMRVSSGCRSAGAGELDPVPAVVFDEDQPASDLLDYKRLAQKRDSARLQLGEGHVKVVDA
jgi:hypothetical protein